MNTTTTPPFDLGMYMGTWYQVLATPTPYQAGCKNSQATYALRTDGRVSVTNRCWVAGQERTIQGVATPVGSRRLYVDFSIPPTMGRGGDEEEMAKEVGNYWVVWIDRDYTLAVVTSGPSSADVDVWVLSRTPNLELASYAAVLCENPWLSQFHLVAS